MVFAPILTLLVAGVLLLPATAGWGWERPTTSPSQRTLMRDAPSAARLRQFLQYLVKVEGLPKGDKSFNPAQHPDRFFPYKDPAGLWTIGYGHLIGDGSSPKGFEQGLTKEEVNVFLTKDASQSMRNARTAVGAEAWGQLDERRRYMLTDYAFNLGPQFHKKFPKFTAAVLAGDDETARKESTRFFKDEESGEMKPLEGRNRDFNALAFSHLPPIIPDSAGAAAGTFDEGSTKKPEGPATKNRILSTLVITPKPIAPKGHQVLDMGNREIPNGSPPPDDNP